MLNGDHGYPYLHVQGNAAEIPRLSALAIVSCLVSRSPREVTVSSDIKIPLFIFIYFPRLKGFGF